VTSTATLFASADFTVAISFCSSTFFFSTPTIKAYSCASALAYSTVIAISLISISS
jgi:hypothetical protein